ncbi:hypothetical protein BO99DRAFT_192607 [Aspergillus violaceofuscus CBS 115571]|uniref:Uncharacterized protein n=1 Tax=Aspergillus violaceofuscus (strain CBS 115571) TaxID=1450538 RepID=A0A2V5H8V0_ASPV1|nr:hypothetical protein BO99DRAFT_192607 [Aspergillus violaceofuscus CBS 115571]
MSWSIRFTAHCSHQGRLSRAENWFWFLTSRFAPSLSAGPGCRNLQPHLRRSLFRKCPIRVVATKSAGRVPSEVWLVSGTPARHCGGSRRQPRLSATH